jgi:hypothetical protein
MPVGSDVVVNIILIIVTIIIKIAFAELLSLVLGIVLLGHLVEVHHLVLTSLLIDSLLILGRLQVGEGKGVFLLEEGVEVGQLDGTGGRELCGEGVIWEPFVVVALSREEGEI